MRPSSSLASLASLASLGAALLASACSPGSDRGPTAPGATPRSPQPDLGAAPAPEAPPALRLPADVHPTAEQIELTVDPAQERFAGSVEIAVTLDRARGVLWMHGEGLHVTRATVTPEGGPDVEASWAPRGPRGMAALTLAHVIPLGRAKIRIAFDAPFGTALDGLYKTKQGGVPYAFTQFEAIEARTAFPCFDEPAFKLPWDVTLVVPRDAQAIANTREIDRKAEGPDRVRVHFAPTLPLPSYLLAFAVGPLDVVQAPDVPSNAVRRRPLPLRGVTARGRGKEIAYALAHTGEILATLETYFGIEYPYDKLDILAVPDKGGAMENPGAVTFGEWLVLMDDKTVSLAQRRSYADVMAHELAHQWFGDLVTMQWWDDTWLNEAFATWIGSKAADAWDPRTHAEMNQLARALQAMHGDGAVSARAVRQPIASPDDIANAFDSITYEKGGAVIRMFERWVGAEAFQRGVRDHLARHRFGSATADDFLAAVSRAAGKDVKTPFQTFLDQPGVPFVESELRCDGAPRIHLTQSRYLPVGSGGNPDPLWQIPVCARVGGVRKESKETREACTLLTTREGELPLGKAGDACPSWVMPNADANGYYRFGMSSADRVKLRQADPGALTTRDRVAVGDALGAGFSRASLSFKDVMDLAVPFARDTHPEVVRIAQAPVWRARYWMEGDALAPAVEAYARQLMQPAFASLGWTRRPTDDDDRVALRAEVISFLGLAGRDMNVRGEARRRAAAFLGAKDGPLHPEAIDKDLTLVVLHLAGIDAEAAEWARARAVLEKTEDEDVRNQLLVFLGAAQRPELATKARELALDPVLRVTEVPDALFNELETNETREATWRWLKEHIEPLLERIARRNGSMLVHTAGAFCDDAHAADVEAFFTPRLAGMDGGPRVLAETLEGIRLCAALRKAQEPAVRRFFTSRK
jgi:alanyl aminopeptidase